MSSRKSDALWAVLQVQETLPEEVLGKMHAPPKQDVPIINASQLPEADGYLFASPTRFGLLSLRAIVIHAALPCARPSGQPQSCMQPSVPNQAQCCNGLIAKLARCMEMWTKHAG